MKQSLLKTLAIGLLAMVGVNALADDFTPTTDVFFRTSLSESTYSWSSGYPKTASETNNEFAGNHRVGMFVLQKYTVDNLAAVKSLTLTLTGASGTDAVAIWNFTNDWTASTEVATLASEVNTAVGLNLNTTGTPSKSPLVDGTNSKTSVASGINACTFTISGTALTTLKNAAEGNTFTLLLTNKTTDMTNANSSDRKFYSSGHATESYRPTITVTYDAVGVTYGDGIKTNYSSFEAARSAVASAAQDATIVVMENQNITSRVNAITGKTITVKPGKTGITLTNTASNALAFLANASNAGTINIGCADYNLTLTNSAATTNNVIETSGNSADAIINVTNVTFSNISSSNVSGLVKANDSNGKITLEDITFDGCTVSAENAGFIYCNANGLVTLKGDLTFTSCTGNSFKLKGRMIESSFNANQIYTIYNDGIALGASAVIEMNAANRNQYSLVNVDRCIVGKGNTGTNNEELVVSEAYTLSVSDANAATLVIPFATTIPEGVTCYTLSYTGGENVTATPVSTTLSANTPVLVMASGSAEGTKYKFNASTRAESSTPTSTDVEEANRTSGILVGNYTAGYTVPTGSYILQNQTGGLGFYKVSDARTLGANRAYMNVSKSSARGVYGIDFGDGTTSIQIVDQETSNKFMDGKTYSLTGVQVDEANLTKGIYIKNGKKFIVK